MRDHFTKNAFDILRLFAAFQVMFGHIVEHFELVSLDLFNNALIVSQFIPGRGVIIFFAISGFLAIPSIEKTDIKTYVKKKALRIYPELWCACLINTALIWILHGMPESWWEKAAYFISQFTFFQFYTGDWLRDYGAGTANGALWTIAVLLQFYMFAYLFYLYFYHLDKWFWLFFIAAAQVCSIVMSNCSSCFPPIVYKLFTVSLFPYLHIFLIGMFVYKYSDEMIPFLKLKWLHIFCVYILVKILIRGLGMSSVLGVNYDVFSALLLSLVTIGAAYRFGTFRLKYEVSYGIFIYHMIIVNVWMEFLKTNGVWTEIGWRLAAGVCTVICTAAMSLASLIFVAKPARRLLKGR